MVRKNMIIFYNRGNYTIYELKGGRTIFYVHFKGGRTIFCMHFKEGRTIFYMYFKGAKRFLTVYFYVWPHTCPITIASSLSLE